MIPIFVPIFVVLSIIGNVVVILLILSNKDQTKNKVTWMLIGSIASIGIWVVITSFQLDPLSQENNLVGFAISAAISNIFILFGILFLSSFINYLVRPNVNLDRLIIMTGLISFNVGMYIILVIGAFDGNNDLVDLALTLANLSNLLFVLSYIIWARNDFKLLLGENLPPSLHRRILMFYASSVIGFVGNLPILLLAWFVDQSYLAFSYLLIPIAMTILSYNYIKDPRVAFVLSERTYLAITVNSFGAMQYSKSFVKDEDDGLTIIVSGVLSAISSIMSEFYKTPVQPQLIEFQERKILLRWSEGYFLAVFTDRDSSLIRLAMEQTVIAIADKYGSKLDQYLKSPEILDLDSIFDKTFYFVIMD